MRKNLAAAQKAVSSYAGCKNLVNRLFEIPALRAFSRERLDVRRSSHSNECGKQFLSTAAHTALPISGKKLAT